MHFVFRGLSVIYLDLLCDLERYALPSPAAALLRRSFAPCASALACGFKKHCNLPVLYGKCKSAYTDRVGGYNSYSHQMSG